MKKRDVIIIVVVVAAALLVFMADRLIPQSKTPTAGEFVSSNTAAPAADNTAEPTSSDDAKSTEAKPSGSADSETAAAAPTAADLTSPKPEADAAKATAVPTLPPAKSYLKIQVGNAVYDPIPLIGEDRLTIRQPNGMENVVKVTEESVKMFSANCDNQDCIYQGEITLENRNTRVLQNMIICLPNHVVLELLTPEEAQLDWESLYQD